MKKTITLLTALLLSLNTVMGDDNELFTPLSGDIEGYASLGDVQANSYGTGIPGIITSFLEVFIVLISGSWIIYKEGRGEPWL